MDAEDRTAHVKEVKAKLGFDLPLSSKRITHGYYVKSQIPSLDFKLALPRGMPGQKPIIKPHEMQWNLKDFMRKMPDMAELRDQRAMAEFEETTQQAYEALDRMLEMDGKKGGKGGDGDL